LLLDRDKNKIELRDGHRSILVPVDALGRQRYLASAQVRSKGQANADGSIPFIGHASVFNRMTLIGGKRWGFWEQIAERSFTKTIGEADVRMLKNHNPDWILARSRPGKPSTLRLSQDDIGLVSDADMAPTSYALDLAISMARMVDGQPAPDINQMSFAFEPVEYTIGEADDGLPLYTVTEARLFDVSVVTYPAYEDADCDLRGAAFNALCRSQGWDPNSKLEELYDMANERDSKQKRESEYGAIDDGDSHEDQTLNCVTCGRNLEPDMLFCPACGGATGAPASEASDPAPQGAEGETGRQALVDAQLRMARSRLSLT
jgi:HK97 family phage prohead protease